MNSNQIIQLATIIIAAIFILWQFIKYRKKHWAPSYITGLGILGTFIGILVGLMFFDTDAIQESVPNLLAGIKFSFITSVLGMSLALWARKQQEGEREKDTVQSAVLTPELFADYLQAFKIELTAIKEHVLSVNSSLVGDGDTSINTQLTKVRADVRDSLKDMTDSIDEKLLPGVSLAIQSIEKVSQAIVSDDDTSLTTQLIKLRSDVSDTRKELIAEVTSHKTDVLTELNKIVEKILASNNDVLVEALQNTIKDFNDKLTEQFGENFKALNAAVEKLVTWQEQYRLHIEELTNLYEQNYQGIRGSEESLKVISQHQTELVSTHKRINEMISQFSTQTLELQSQFGTLSEVTANAKDVFPVLEKNLESLTVKLNENLTKTIDSTDNIIDDQRKLNDKVQEQFSELIKSTEKYTKDFSAEVKEEYIKLTRELTEELRTAFSKSSEQIENQINALDEALEKELRSSLNSLGKQLASLSGKFVEDYTPLTESLREVVRIAKGVNNYAS